MLTLLVLIGLFFAYVLIYKTCFRIAWIQASRWERDNDKGWLYFKSFLLSLIFPVSLPFCLLINQRQMDSVDFAQWLASNRGERKQAKIERQQAYINKLEYELEIR